MRTPKKAGLAMFEHFLQSRTAAPHLSESVEPDPESKGVSLFQDFEGKEDPYRFGAYKGYWRHVLIGSPSWQHPAFQVLAWTDPHAQFPRLVMPILHDFAMGVTHSMYERSNWLVPPTQVPASTAHAIGSGSFPIAVGRGTTKMERAFPKGAMHSYQPLIHDKSLSRRMATLRFHPDGSIDARSLAKGVHFEANVYFER